VRDDYFTDTEADAGLYERRRAQDDYDDDRPSPSDLADECSCDCTCSIQSGPAEDCHHHGAFGHPGYNP